MVRWVRDMDVCVKEVRLTFQQPGDVTGPVPPVRQTIEQGDA
jgi:hypothetical protein